MWRYLFDPDVGLREPGDGGDRACRRSNGRSIPSHGLILVALLSIWLHLPFTFIILYAARLALPTGALRGGRDRRRDGWQPFRRITLPLLMPALLIAVLFRYIFAFRLFSEVWLLTGGGPGALRRRCWPSISISKRSATTLSARRPRPAGCWCRLAPPRLFYLRGSTKTCSATYAA